MGREITAPAKVWVGTYEFSLEFLPPDDPSLVVKGKPSDGVTDVELQTIAFAHGLDDRRLMEVALHECQHAMDFAYGISTRVRKVRCEDRHEEMLAQTCGVAWSQFWIDNPKFIRWYTQLANSVRRERA